jgi:hypothetical protein
MTPVRILHEGELAEAQQLTFSTEGSVVSQVVLAEDGAKLEFQVGLVSLFKLLEKRQADGKPIYVFMTKLEAKITPPVVSEGTS